MEMALRLTARVSKDTRALRPAYAAPGSQVAHQLFLRRFARLDDQASVSLQNLKKLQWLWPVPSPSLWGFAGPLQRNNPTVGFPFECRRIETQHLDATNARSGLVGMSVNQYCQSTARARVGAWLKKGFDLNNARTVFIV